MGVRVKLRHDKHMALYRHIAEEFRTRIAKGELPPGTRLPTVRAEGEAVCLRLSKEAFRQLLQKPGFALFFSARLAERLRLLQPVALHLPDLGQPADEAAEAPVWLEASATIAQGARLMRELQVLRQVFLRIRQAQQTLAARFRLQVL